MKKSCVTTLLLFLSLCARAQDICPDALRAQEGSYELIPQSKIIEVFTIDVLCEIEARRSETQIVNWHVSDYTIIRILPRKPLPERLIQTEQ